MENKKTNYRVNVHRVYNVELLIPASSAEEAKEIVEWSDVALDSIIGVAMTDPNTIQDEVITAYDNTNDLENILRVKAELISILGKDNPYIKSLN
jgi:hypothetical protein